MDWLPSLTRTIFMGMLVLLGVYGLIYSLYRLKSILLWSFAWLCYLVSIGLNGLVFLAPGAALVQLLPYGEMIEQLARLGGGGFLLWGGYLFTEQRFSARWGLFFGFGILGMVLAGAFLLPSPLIIGFSSILQAIIYFWMGWFLIRTPNLTGKSKIFSGVLFMGWGAANVLSLFFLLFPEVLEWVLLFSNIFASLVGTGFLLVYYDSARAENKRITQALQRSESKYRDLVEMMSEGLVAGDTEGKITYVNRRFCEMLKRKPEDILGHAFGEFLDEKYRSRWSENYQLRAMGRASSYEIEILNRYYVASGNPLRNDQGEMLGAIGVLTDITENKKAELQLEQRMQELSVLNRLGRRLNLSLPAEENIQAILSDILIPLQADLALLFLYQNETLVYKESVSSHKTREIKTPDEAFIRYLNQLTFHAGRGFYVADLKDEPSQREAFTCLAPMTSMAILPIGIDQQKIGALVVATIDYKDFGEHASFLETLVDAMTMGMQNALLHDQVQRHAEILEKRVAERTAQLQAANEELEAFSYSVSHDLRAPLRAIDNFSQVLVEDYESVLDEIARQYLRRLRSNTQRMGALIDALLDLARLSRSELQRRWFDLSLMTRSIIADLTQSDPKRKVEWVIGEKLQVWADPRLMRVVLDNLLRNAWKFTGKKEEARIELGVMEGEDGRIYFVRDNGAGFNMVFAQNLFGAFQRLHSSQEFEGTGIGLATVRRVIHRHGGKIWAVGETGKGATFYFTVPDSDDLRGNRPGEE